MSGSVPAISETSPVRIIRAIRELFQGRSNAVGVIALAPGATTTVVSAVNCSISSHPVLFPATANAAAAVATTYVSAVRNGEFVVTHANNAQPDRTFHWVALG